jgi:hypothetical protein
MIAALKMRVSVLTIRVASGVAATALMAIVIQLALLERAPPVRCPGGLLINAGRCCGNGQSFAGGRCEGRASACGPGQDFVETEGGSGCLFANAPVAFAGGRLPQGVADWQLSASPAALEVAPFSLDSGEVSVARYDECVRAGTCPKLATEREIGQPVSGLAPSDAERFCAFAGGRLPSSAEWRFAASGLEGRRFPWGFTGLVCRRAAFGLVQGPCSSEGNGPDLVGARPDGATPEGIVDLAGNVAEWTRDPDGRYRARGGSYHSRVAVELVTAAVENPAQNAAYVGFRCAYAEQASARAGTP